MSRRIIKFVLTTIGVAILTLCITGEVDGVGRGAMVISGIVSIYIGYFIKEK